MFFRSVAFVLVSLASAGAQGQVHRSNSGLGGALIIPYWTVAKGNDTLLSIRNGSDDATVAKVRILGEDGALLQSFSLYLDARAVWNSAFAQFEGVAKLLPRPAGCVLPAEIASDMEFALPAIPLDGAWGSIEIIEMALATNASEQLINAGQWAPCDALANEFESGSWSQSPNHGLAAPSQLLSAAVRIINVAVGGMSTVTATALRGFSDVPQHTAPDQAAPDLSRAFDSGAPQGTTRSLVCSSTGCRMDDWDLPIKAVAAALTVSSMRVDYSVAPSLAAGFDWMIHRPLERYENEEDEFTIDSFPTLIVRNRSGATTRGAEVCITPPPWTPACGTSEFPIDQGLVHQNLAFNARWADLFSTIESAVLGHPTIIRPGFVLGDIEFPEYQEGTAELRFVGSGEGVEFLVASDGTVFVGEPVISFAVQQYANGTLVDDQGQAVLANYRSTETPRRILRLEESD